MSRYVLGWAMTLAFLFLGTVARPHASAAHGTAQAAEPAAISSSDVAAAAPGARATLEGKVRSVDSENGRLTVDLLAPAAVRHPGRDRQAPIPNRSEVAQAPEGRVTVHGTPRQLAGLTVGEMVTLPTLHYEAEVWLAPRYEARAPGGTAEPEGQEVREGARSTLRGRIVGVDAPHGELAIAKASGATVSLRSHPSALLELHPGERVNVTARAFGDTRWAESVRPAAPQAQAGASDASTPQGTKDPAHP